MKVLGLCVPWTMCLCCPYVVVVIHRQSAVLGRNTSVRDASSKGNVVQGTHRPRDASSKNWFRDTMVRDTWLYLGSYTYEGAIGKPTSLSDPLVDIWQRYLLPFTAEYKKK